MNELLNKTAFSLLKKNKVQDCTAEEMRVIINHYPFFPVSRLLYTSVLKQAETIDYNKELQKTSLYFNNPLWLDFLLTKSIENTTENSAEYVLKSLPPEDSNNDELVVENPRPDILKSETLASENKHEQIITEITETKETKFVFEPYYTVDYFASQGIKPIEDVKPNDQLGQQLKSFTEWLKSLKTLPLQQLSPLENLPLEEKVIHLADHSIENRNVDTESMAEVWIKQGNPEKAIDIYGKLSLLNPSKSSYFASLIEKLKKN